MPRGIPAAGFRVTKNSIAKKVTNLPVMKMVVSNETDDEIRAKLKERFSAMDKMAEAAILGSIKSLIISGPAGLGKSHGVMQIADHYAEEDRQVTFIKGFVRPTGLYKTLYENRHPHCVIVFDDADSIFNDDISLNLLKGACDMTRTRTLHWLAETNMRDEDEEKLPRHFEFEGSIVFITNYDFDSYIAKGNRLSPHFEAMISRSIYLDLAMHSNRDYLIRIEQVMASGMADSLKLTARESSMIIDFIKKNSDQLRELSLRMVVKIANLMRMDTANWERLVKVTCFRAKTVICNYKSTS